MSHLRYPLQSLQTGRWFKLICGASYQYLPAVRSMSLAYALAGADCIDVAADPAVVAAARGGLSAARCLRRQAEQRGFNPGVPWLMVSINDGDDPHFRKAEFDSAQCPQDCSRPCETVCPAGAIRWDEMAGVIADRCYGCGRCLPVCPQQSIATQSKQLSPAEAAQQLERLDIDAIEIHTQVGRKLEFLRLWDSLAPLVARLKLLAISCQDGPSLTDYLRGLAEAIEPLPCPLLWQTDGRPMSGDLGAGATRAAVRLAQEVLAAQLPGYVQPAGGTNQHTVPKLDAAGLLGPTQSGNFIAGVAYGSYARSVMVPVLDALEASNHRLLAIYPGMPPAQLEDKPLLLWQAVARARALTAQLSVAVPITVGSDAVSSICR
ncbi:circadian clock protein LdpA [Rubidibacter lacunae]|uniref:circadian clock protein LdpA n=1 Tax=Rubidibacter lacunae TaxID=582514 RepID=UPI000420B676|nr:LdpA C-terminal domain-containing domain [Rubidibacter lacunae]